MGKKETNKEIKLTLKQKRFVEEYCIDFNATRAACAAGYSEKTAFSIGSENLRKPYIQDAIKVKLNDLSLTADQTLKMMSDIAKSSLNEYFVKKKVEKSVKVKKSLVELIDDIKESIVQKEMFCQRKGLKDEALAEHQKLIEYSKDEILRYEIELERNPEAHRIVSEIVFTEDVVLDLVKLTEDTEKGRIKSFQWGEFGPKVELYAADKMLTNIANAHGMFTNKIQMLDKNGNPADPQQSDPLAPVNLTVQVVSNADIQPTAMVSSQEPEAGNP